MAVVLGVAFLGMLSYPLYLFPSPVLVLPVVFSTGWIGWVVGLHLSNIGGAFLIEEEEDAVEEEGSGRKR